MAKQLSQLEDALCTTWQGYLKDTIPRFTVHVGSTYDHHSVIKLADMYMVNCLMNIKKFLALTNLTPTLYIRDDNKK